MKVDGIQQADRRIGTQDHQGDHPHPARDHPPPGGAQVFMARGMETVGQQQPQQEEDERVGQEQDGHGDGRVAKRGMSLVTRGCLERGKSQMM